MRTHEKHILQARGRPLSTLKGLLCEHLTNRAVRQLCKKKRNKGKGGKKSLSKKKEKKKAWFKSKSLKRKHATLKYWDLIGKKKRTSGLLEAIPSITAERAEYFDAMQSYGWTCTWQGEVEQQASSLQPSINFVSTTPIRPPNYWCAIKRIMTQSRVLCSNCVGCCPRCTAALPTNHK